MKKICTYLVALTIVLSINGCSGSHVSNSSKQKVDSKNQVVKNQNITPSITPTNTQDNSNENSVQESPTDIDSSQNSNKGINKTTQYSFFGNWEVKGVIGYAKVFSEDDGKDVEGKKLTFSGESASSNGDICKNPIYKVTQIDKYDFESGYGINKFRDLGINGNSISEVLVSKEDGKEWEGSGAFFYVKDENTLIIDAGGRFYEVVRVK
ncbi:MAG: hypothetical protein Q8900_00530 [Bacillota bacterium]|nr:hypothetical protein [Bacillota bacterium]